MNGFAIIFQKAREAPFQHGGFWRRRSCLSIAVLRVLPSKLAGYEQRHTAGFIFVVDFYALDISHQATMIDGEQAASFNDMLSHCFGP
jgi:hypothetical protein